MKVTKQDTEESEAERARRERKGGKRLSVKTIARHIPTPSADELKAVAEKLIDGELSNEDWIIISACVCSIAMLQTLIESGASVGPFEVVDDNKPCSVIDAIMNVKLEVRK